MRVSVSLCSCSAQFVIALLPLFDVCALFVYPFYFMSCLLTALVLSFLNDSMQKWVVLTFSDDRFTFGLP